MKSYSIHKYNHSIEGKLHSIGDAPYATVVLKSDRILFEIPAGEALNYPVSGVISFDDLTAYTDDHGVISIFTEQRPQKIVVENTIQRTFIGRKPIRDFTGHRLLAQLITPYKGSDPDTWDLILLQDGNTKFEGFPELDEYELLTDWHKAKFEDNLELEASISAAPGDKVEIMVENLIPAPVFLEATAGNLSHYRVQDSQTITLDTTGLNSGEVVKIKAGRRYYPGIKEITVSIE